VAAAPHEEDVMRIQPSSATPVQTSTPFSALVSQKSPAAPTTQSTPTSSASPATATDATANTGDVQSSLDQSQDQNLEFLQLQSQMNSQSETFTTLSNVMKTENDTIRNTAGNMQI
jgi:hypothetical protein